MTTSQIYSSYLLWLGSCPPLPIQRLFDHPVANCDIFEDDHTVVNRLFFLVPHALNGELKCFSFFEDNTFSKDHLGDLSLASSSLNLIP